MTPTPPRILPDMTGIGVKELPSSPPIANALFSTGEVDGDARSSSLSDIEDTGVNERTDPVGMEAASDSGDTEAETERLEDSPHKVRTHQNVILSAPTAGQQNGNGAINQTILLTTEPNSSMAINGDVIAPTSDISTLGDSSEDSRTSPSRKRKRSANLQSGRASIETQAQAIGDVASGTTTPTGARLDTHVVDEAELDNSDAEGRDHSKLNDPDDQQTGLPTSSDPYPKGKRKARKTNSNKHRQASEQPVPKIGVPVEMVEAYDNNGEDAEMEDAVDGADLDVTAKSEEDTAKKKTAMDTLGAIEKCFANLKEKLYDERIARCDAELAMLEFSTPTHPELLAALEIIDRHRDQKIRYEDTRFKYKLESLQRTSVAEKAQAHSQYMLEVQNTREKHIDQLNKEFYQIQRERRSAETTAPDYMYHYNPKRSQQIKRQTAYNKEVSILSGVAKYVGFPAAPDLKPLKQNEIDDDLKAMGIPLRAPQPQPSLPRPNLPAPSSFSRQRSLAADEHFLERNAWANPQHPAHSQLQRQRSAVSRPESPLNTPAPQRRVVDLTGLQGSASTIPDMPSFSITTTPTGEQAAKDSKARSGLFGGNERALEILAKAPDMHSTNRAAFTTSSSKPPREQPTNISTPLQVPNSQSQSQAHSKVKAHSHPLNVANSVPRFEVTANPKSNAAASPPGFPSIKAEEPIHGLHQTPLLHHYQTPTPVSAGINGGGGRLGV